MSSLINVGAAGANIVGWSTELGKLIVVFQECAPSPRKGTVDIKQRCYTLFAGAINQRSLPVPYRSGIQFGRHAYFISSSIIKAFYSIYLLNEDENSKAPDVLMCEYYR